MPQKCSFVLEVGVFRVWDVGLQGGFSGSLH